MVPRRMRAWRRLSTAMVLTAWLMSPVAVPLPMVLPSDMRPTFCGTVMRAARSLARQISEVPPVLVLLQRAVLVEVAELEAVHGELGDRGVGHVDVGRDRVGVVVVGVGVPAGRRVGGPAAMVGGVVEHRLRRVDLDVARLDAPREAGAGPWRS